METNNRARAQQWSHGAHMLRLVSCAFRERIASASDRAAVDYACRETVNRAVLTDDKSAFEHIYSMTKLDRLHVRFMPDGGDREACAGPIQFADNIVRPRIQNGTQSGISDTSWALFLEELSDSIRNEAEIYLQREVFYKHIEDQYRSYETLFHLLAAWPTLNADFPEAVHDRDSFLLQLASFSGHRTHPISKARLRLDPYDHAVRVPLSLEDLRTYSPEFAPDVCLPVLAVHKSRVSVQVSPEAAVTYTDFFARRFPSVFSDWRKQLDSGESQASQEYVPIPVHPLQLPEIRVRFAEQMASGTVKLLDDVRIEQRPTLSFRTMTPVGRPLEPQIKLTAAMQMTSEVRIIPPSLAYNAPVLSDVLCRIVRSDPDLNAVLRVSPEPASVYWGRDPERYSQDYTDGRQLCAVFKENPARQVGDDEIRMPISALFAPSPLSGVPVVGDIIRFAGAIDGERFAEFMSRYIRIVIASDIGLLARYGIALESHQQNADMVFGADGWPRALVYRDISDGVNVYEPLLQANGYDVRPLLHPYVKGLHATIAGPLQQVIHASFASHLLPVVSVAARLSGQREKGLHKITRQTVLSVLAEAQTRHASRLQGRFLESKEQTAQSLCEAAHQEIAEAVLERPMVSKCLLRMRAMQSIAPLYSTFDNPLRDG